MRKILICFVLYFQTAGLFAQLSPGEHRDSLFESIRVSDKDWAITLSIDRAGSFYDSLGNSFAPEGTFTFYKIGEDYFVQKFSYEYYHSQDTTYTKVIMGNRLGLRENVDLNYSIDSILQAYKEWIYPFIYKDDSTNAYNVQHPSTHTPDYTMYFKIPNRYVISKSFTITSLTESYSFLSSKNLNYLYNTSTFVYRSFTKLLSLIETNRKVLDDQ